LLSSLGNNIVTQLHLELSSMLKEANICQVAIVSKQAKLLRSWYCDMFGFLPASQTIFTGPLATRVQGVPKDLNFCYWAVDGKRQFQLEFFNFISPKVNPKPDSWQPYDHGYNIIGIHSWDFEQTLARLQTSQTCQLSAIKGEQGQRWLMVTDPDGNYVEVTEADPLVEQYKVYPEIPATVRYVRMSVADINQAQLLWQSSFGLTENSSVQLPKYHDEILFPKQPPNYQQCLLQGQGILLELRQYEQPMAKPRLANHNVTDQGIMNIAIGADSVSQWNDYYNGALQQCQPNGKPLDAGIFKVMYVNEPNKENIEILYPRKWAYALTGFNPSGVFARGDIVIDASIERVWQCITDHNNAGSWAFFSSKLVRAGDQDKNGLKALRKITLFGLSFQEEITGWHEQQAYLYRLKSKWMLRNHRGMLNISSCGKKVKLSWSIHFSAPLPGLGKISSLILTVLIKASLKKLKKQLQG